MVNITGEIARLEDCTLILERLRVLFYAMKCDGERYRAWEYLRSRFGEFEQADMPAYIEVEDEIRESE